MNHQTWKNILLALGAAGTLASLASLAKAGTIHWGNAVGDVLVQSDGATFLDSSFHFELGTFDTSGGWAPTLGNAAEWLGRWKRLDTASYNSSTGQFAGTVTLNSTSIIDGDPNPSGPVSLWHDQPAYIWTYDSTDPVPGSEWSLITNTGWTFPNATDDPRDPSLDNFYLSNSGTSALFGREGGDGAPTTGEGVFTGAAPSGFDVQTFTFTTPIPEPGTFLLLLLALLPRVARRRRA